MIAVALGLVLLALIGLAAMLNAGLPEPVASVHDIPLHYWQQPLPPFPWDAGSQREEFLRILNDIVDESVAAELPRWADDGGPA